MKEILSRVDDKVFDALMLGTDTLPASRRERSALCATLTETVVAIFAGELAELERSQRGSAAAQARWNRKEQPPTDAANAPVQRAPRRRRGDAAVTAALPLPGGAADPGPAVPPPLDNGNVVPAAPVPEAAQAVTSAQEALPVPPLPPMPGAVPPPTAAPAFGVTG